MAPRAGPGPVPWQAVAAGAACLVLLAGLGLALDLDLDGDASWTELREGTTLWSGDTDQDGLEDGWERAAGLDARLGDSDADGVGDRRELELGADPLRPDTDRDGLPDNAEEMLPDCDGDGRPAIAEGDGDADGRLDALEAAGDRCVRDADGDAVPDGSEGNERCVHDPDCDDDGLTDGNESAAAGGFDPLDPDSFGSGVSDAISAAFQASGQPPGADADDDGIPDGWEGEDGLIVWGDLRPQPGQRDLLVEFLRVQGPDSARHAGLSFAPAYESIAAVLQAEGGIVLRWTETRVAVDAETDPQLVPQLEDPYYTHVLSQGRHSGNPYVTTVVLNPQHDQSQVFHAGVAPIRGMLAAVDYGTQVTFTFTSPRLAEPLRLEPFLESVVRAKVAGADVAIGDFTSMQITGGEMVLTRPDGLQLRWQPNWFRTNPRVVLPDGETIPLNLTSVTVGQGSLAGTILHELGHTLGLCHAHEPECYAKFTAADRMRQAESTMSYDAPSNQLHFLASEWSTVLQYVSCPPDGPVTAVAHQDGADAVLAEKYGYANKNITAVDLRACNDLTAVPRQFTAGVPAAQDYLTPATYLSPADTPRGAALTLLFLGAALAATAVCVVLVSRLVRARPPVGPPPAPPAAPGPQDAPDGPPGP